MLRSSSQHNRQLQYKNAGRGGTANGSARDLMRKSCLDKLKAVRTSSHDARRSIKDHAASVVQETVNDEMPDASPEDQLAMYELLLEEVLREQYEAEVVECDEERDEVLADHLRQLDVFCPRCKLRPMRVDDTGCACTCGFSHRFPTPGPTVEQFAERLQTAFSLHADTGCELLPDPIQLNYSPTLSLVCTSCGHSSPVL